MIDKTAIRKHARALRKSMTEGEWRELSRQIVQRAQAELDWTAYRRIHLFLPIDAQREVDTWPLLRWIWDEHPRIKTYVPHLEGDEWADILANKESEYEVNRLGAPQPKGSDRLHSGESLDLILVPLLAFDRNGHRVGYGGGFYDRFLASHTEAYAVGLAYESSLIVEGIASEPHDVALQSVVTESKAHRFQP